MYNPSMTCRLASLARVATTTLILTTASPVLAHISLEKGGTHRSRYGDFDADKIKSHPCGREGGGRGTNVYTYRPGETIKIELVEEIAHPGYFRIAFDADGDDDFVNPSGTEGTDGDCAGDPACGEGKADYCNSPSVMWDNLDQHAGSFLDSGKTYTWTITLPDVECDNCTLQIIQMMNDLNVHTADYPEDDLYYQCIDLVLSNDAPEVDDAPVQNDGMECESFDAMATMGPGGGETDGGTTTAPDAGMPDAMAPGSDGGGMAPTTGGTNGTTAGGSSGGTTTGAPSTGTGTTGTGATGATTTSTGTATSGTATGGTTGATTTTTGTTGTTGASPSATESAGGCAVASRSPTQASFAGALVLLGLTGLLWRRPRGCP